MSQNNAFSSNGFNYVSPPVLSPSGAPFIVPASNIKPHLKVERPGASRLRYMSATQPMGRLPINTLGVACNKEKPGMPLLTKQPLINAQGFYNQQICSDHMKNKALNNYTLNKNGNAFSKKNKSSRGKEKSHSAISEENNFQLKIQESGNNQPEKISIRTTINKPNTRTASILQCKGSGGDNKLGWWDFGEKSQFCENLEKYKEIIKEKYKENRKICNNRSLTPTAGILNKFTPNEYLYIPPTNQKVFRSKVRSKTPSQAVSDFHKVNLKPITGFLQSYQAEKDRVKKPTIIKVSKHPFIIQDHSSIYGKKKDESGFPYGFGQKTAVMNDNENQNLNNTKGFLEPMSQNFNKNVHATKIPSGADMNKGIMFKYKHAPIKDNSTVNKNAQLPPEKIHIRLKNEQRSNKRTNQKLKKKNKSSRKNKNSEKSEGEYESESISDENLDDTNIGVHYKNNENRMRRVKVKKYRIESNESREFSQENHTSEDETEEESEEDEEYETYEENEEKEYEDTQCSSSNYSGNKRKNIYQHKNKKPSGGNCKIKSLVNANKSHINNRKNNNSNASSFYLQNDRGYNSENESEYTSNEDYASPISDSNYSNGKNYIEGNASLKQWGTSCNSKKNHNMSRDIVQTKSKKKSNETLHNVNKSKTKFSSSFANKKRETFDTEYNSENNMYNTYNSSSGSEMQQKRCSREKYAIDIYQPDSYRCRNDEAKTSYKKHESYRSKHYKKNDEYSSRSISDIEASVHEEDVSCNSSDYSRESSSRFKSNQNVSNVPYNPRRKQICENPSYLQLTEGRSIKTKTGIERSVETNRKHHDKIFKMLDDAHLEKEFEDTFNDSY